MTSPDTAYTKPSTMEAIKDKASHLVHKITGKSHSEPDATTTIPHKNHDTDFHTGAAATGTAVPHGNPVDRAAYNEHIQNQGTDHSHHGTDHGKEVAGLASGAVVAEAVDHHRKEHEHELERERGVDNQSGVVGHEHHHFHNNTEAAALTSRGVPVNTTTDAATHIPGHYNASIPVATSGEHSIPGTYSTNAGAKPGIDISRPLA